jgi:hypothetical protein
VGKKESKQLWKERNKVERLKLTDLTSRCVSNDYPFLLCIVCVCVCVCMHTCSARNLAHRLMNAGQVPYHWAVPPAPYSSFFPIFLHALKFLVGCQTFGFYFFMMLVILYCCNMHIFLSRGLSNIVQGGLKFAM